jgi:radical SAM superfamily enzyme YgiQ (UPF0313 family)
VKQVKFVDRTFNCDRKHADAIWTYLKEHDNGITNFHFEISADILQEEEIALLRSMRPGLVQLEIGVQSCNEDTLQAINRRMQLDELEKIVAAIKEGGNVHQHLDLIAGLPYENLESFKQSFNRVYRMRPDQLQLGFLKLLKGTNMYAQREEYGIVHGEKPPYEVLYTKWITYEELLLLKRVEEMVERYYNSGQFVQTLSVIERAFDSPFALYEKLAAFYEEKKLFLNNPSRMYRYQVLLEFAQRYDEKNAPLYRELLTYDLYLRENSMSRPPFGTDIYRFKENIREYYQAEDGPDRSTTHIEPFTYPVWDLHCLAQGGVASMEDPHFVLFDYAKRSPLDHSARICLLHFGKTGQDSCKSEETTV